VKLLKVSYVGGHEELLLVDDLTANWDGWDHIDFTSKTPLFVSHQGGTARINLTKVVNFQLLNKQINLSFIKQNKTFNQEENPLNRKEFYDNPLS